MIQPQYLISSALPSRARARARVLARRALNKLYLLMATLFRGAYLFILRRLLG